MTSAKEEGVLKFLGFRDRSDSKEPPIPIWEADPVLPPKTTLQRVLDIAFALLMYGLIAVCVIGSLISRVPQ